MKRLGLALLFFGFSSLLVARSTAQTPPEAMHAPSGGTSFHVDSIEIPSLPNAPFTATVSTTLVRTLTDGNSITYKNHRTVARDAAGRIFQERRLFYPQGNPHENELNQIEISDPDAELVYYCHPALRICEVQDFSPRVFTTGVAAGPLNDGKFLTRVLLGSDTVNGLETVGTRETTTINAGVAGNDRAISIVKEFWYSSQLGINLIEKRQDPSFGTQSFLVDQISLSEPDQHLFDIPAGYRILDVRSANQAAPDSAGNKK